MSSKTNSPEQISDTLKAVVDQFTPDILGLFWITEDELSRDLPGFDEFNYLFDGLISQYLYGQMVTEKKPLPRANIFFTKNFNKKLFLAHIKQDGDVAGALDEQVALIQENTGERKKILIYSQNDRKWIVELKKRYPKFDFYALEL
ncbi:MAG: hypothetical protein WC635_04140 [Bacteriovorax sp.]|jgi:hypothetical protein